MASTERNAQNESKKVEGLRSVFNSNLEFLILISSISSHFARKEVWVAGDIVDLGSRVVR